MSTTLKMFRYLCQTRMTYSKFLNNANILQKSCRSIYVHTKLHGKMFQEHENRYAYDVMKNKGYVGDLLAATSKDVQVSKETFDKLLQEDCSKKTPAQLIEAFLMLGSYCSVNDLCISNKIFDSFIDTLTDNIKQTSDQELRLVFYYLLKWPETESVRTRNFIEVWVALDDECLNRIKKWTTDEMLSFQALFYMLNATRASEFSWKCLQKLASKAKQLTPSQLVQSLFFVGVMRKAPCDMHNLELQLNTLFSEFTVDELAIMSMGFFKSKTPVRSMELMLKVISKITEHTKDIREVSLAALLKIVRYSVKVPTDENIYKLLEALYPEVPRLSLMCNVHLALLGTATLTLHEKCLTEIATTALSDINNARVKDLERLVFTYGTFNMIPKTAECFFQKVVEELSKPERIPEITKHGRSFACCVAYLGHSGVYPKDLMDKVLNPEFLQSAYGKQILTYGREVLAIHNSAKLFLPEADMHRLSDKCAIILAKKYTDYVPSEKHAKQYNISEKMMLDIMKILKEQRGEKYVTGDHILTHHQRGGR